MSRPKISLLVFTYRQASFVDEAVSGALAQSYQPLQIIFSDDCSPDDTYEKLQKAVANYDGPHEVIVNKTARNLGLGAHINEVVNMSDGEWIALAAGDDISLPKRIETMIATLLDNEKNAKVLAAFSDAYGISESGEPIDAEPQIGASGFYHRSLFDKFSPFQKSLRTEDLTLLFRANLLGSSLKLKKPLIRYRVHSSNAWARKTETTKQQRSHAARQLRFIAAQFSQMQHDLEHIDDLTESKTEIHIQLEFSKWHARWQSRLVQRLADGKPTKTFRCMRSKRIRFSSKMLLLLFALPGPIRNIILKIGESPRITRKLGNATVAWNRPRLPAFYRKYLRIQNYVWPSSEEVNDGG